MTSPTTSPSPWPTSSGPPRTPRHGDAYTVELNGKTTIFYVYTAPDGVKLLNKYSPFHSCLDDNAFCRVEVEKDHLVVYRAARINRSTAARKSIADLGWLVTTNF